MAEKHKWGDRIEFTVSSREAKSQSALKVKGLEIFSRNKGGGYHRRVVGRDLRPNKTYTLEKRTFWWILVGVR